MWLLSVGEPTARTQQRISNAAAKDVQQIRPFLDILCSFIQCRSLTRSCFIMLNQPYLLIMFLIPQGIEMTEYTGIILETAEFRKEYDVKFLP